MNVDTCAPHNEITFFHCPACMMAEMSSNKGFHRQRLDLKIKCSICAKNTLAKDWTCLCGKPWFRCDKHAYLTHQELDSPIRRPKAVLPCHKHSVKRKATCYPMTYEVLLQREEKEYNEMRNKKSTPVHQQLVELKGVVPVNKRIKLPPILLDRFPHLGK